MNSKINLKFRDNFLFNEIGPKAKKITLGL